MSDNTTNTAFIRLKPVSEIEVITVFEAGNFLASDGTDNLKRVDNSNVPIKINSIAELRASVGREEGQIVSLLGYNVSGDKATVNYKFTLNDSSLVDDGGSIIKTSSGSWIAQFGEIIDARDFGFFPVSFVPDLSNFNSQQTLFEKVRDFCIINKKDLVLAPGNYCINVFRTGLAVGQMKIKITCNGLANVYLKYTTTPTMVQIWDDCYMENIHFYSLEADLNNQRGSTESRKNIYLKNVGFFNFKNPTNGNAWGLYMKNCSNITLESCQFGGNTQSDIAIVDGVNGVTIINPINTVDTGVYLNIEPNTNIINRNIQLQGGYYRRVNLLTNTITENPIQNMSIIGCEIDWLMYDGADVDIIGSQVKLITNQDFVTAPMGVLDMSLRLGANLIKDPYMVDYDYASTDRFWKYSFSSTLQTDRVNKDFTRIGNRATSATTVLKTDFIPVDVNKKYLFSVNGRGNYFGTAINNISRFCRVRLYDAAFNPIVITKPVAGVPTNFDYITISAFRFPTSTTGTTEFINQTTILEFLQYAPTTAFVVFEVGKFSSNTNEYDIKFLSLNEITGYEKGENISAYISRNMPTGRYNVTTSPPNNATANRTNGFKTGDILQNYTGNTFIVTDGSVRPAVTKDITGIATTTTTGLVKQATAVTDVAATDPAATYGSNEQALLLELKNKVNSILSTSRTAGQRLP